MMKCLGLWKTPWEEVELLSLSLGTVKGSQFSLTLPLPSFWGDSNQEGQGCQQINVCAQKPDFCNSLKAQVSKCHQGKTEDGSPGGWGWEIRVGRLSLN